MFINAALLKMCGNACGKSTARNDRSAEMGMTKLVNASLNVTFSRGLKRITNDYNMSLGLFFDELVEVRAVQYCVGLHHCRPIRTLSSQSSRIHFGVLFRCHTSAKRSKSNTMPFRKMVFSVFPLQNATPQRNYILHNLSICACVLSDKIQC